MLRPSAATPGCLEFRFPAAAHQNGALLHCIQAHWEVDLSSPTLRLCLLCLLLLLRLLHKQCVDALLQQAALLSEHGGRCGQETAVRGGQQAQRCGGLRLVVPCLHHLRQERGKQGATRAGPGQGAVWQ